VAEEEHLLFCNVHHIVFDGWSVEVFLQELAALYGAFCQGEPSTLPELEHQYADYAMWQRQRLQGEVVDKQLAYWQKQLAGLSGIPSLPTDRPRALVQSFRGKSLSYRFRPGIGEELAGLAHGESATLFMTLLAAFQLLLYRYSGQEDIAVGSPFAGRNHSAFERLIGFFVNTLVLRTSVEGHLLFREWVARVRKTVLEAFAHHELPFDKLVEELAPDRSLSYHPLIQVWFSVENDPSALVTMPGLSLHAVEDLPTGTTKFDLTWIIKQQEDDLVLHVEFSSDLFDDETIERMVGQFEWLLEEVIRNPDCRLSDLSDR
jgi:hypothetical protein